MYKRILSAGLVFLFILSMAVPSAYCDDALKKLGRGLCNCLTFPLEIIEQVKRTNLSDGPLAGCTYGLLKGIGMMGVRAMVGVYEVATFPVPLPKNYEPILKDPEFFSEETNW